MNILPKYKSPCCEDYCLEFKSDILYFNKLLVIYSKKCLKII